MSNQSPVDNLPRIQEYRHYPDDEISVVDIALVLYRHRWLMLGIFILCVAVAVGYGLTKARTYEYTTAISIGVTDDNKPIESPEMVKNRLDSAYIPRALRAIALERGVEQDSVRYKVDTTVPKNTDFVVISIKAAETDAEEAKKILTSLVAMVLDVHSKEIERRAGLLHQQIADIEPLLSQKSTGVETDAQLQKLARMEEEMIRLNNRLRQLQGSTQQYEATRSAKPVGSSVRLVVALGALLGLLLAIFAAFIAEFSVKFRRELAEQAVAQ
jgi:capsular polysaccharide biosynthesis protein